MANRARSPQPQEDNFLSHSASASPTAIIMEEYCISPRHFRSSTWSEANAVPVTPPAEVFQLKPGKQTPEAAATIRDLIEEPIFWRGYTSDEEVASPLVDDNRSFDSGSFCYDSEDVVSLHDEAPSPQHSSGSLDTTTDQQAATQAQAVQFLSAGKAKVVSMSTTRSVRTAPSSPARPPVSKMNRMNIEGRTINFSRTITPKSSREVMSSVRDADGRGSMPYPSRVVRRKPDVPALQAMCRSQSPSYDNALLPVTPTAKRSGYVEPNDVQDMPPLSEGMWFSQSSTPEDERPSSRVKKVTDWSRDSDPDPFPAQEAVPVPDSPPFSMPQKRSSNYVLQAPSSTRRPAFFSSGPQDTYTFPESPSLSRPRLLRKLSSTLSFKTFNHPSRQDSFSSTESEKLQPVTEKPSQHNIADMHIPTRTSSKPSIPKMVPRGANERAPPIVIPPCPEDYDDGFDDHEILPAARWPQSKSSTTNCAKCVAAVDVAVAAGVMANEGKTHQHQRRKSHSTSSGSGSS